MSGETDEAVDGAADELYALDPAGFTKARDERANLARDAGDRNAADAIRRLRKPSTSAWLVNMLVRRHPDELAELAELGTALRSAQAELAGDELLRLTEQRRTLIAHLTRLTRTVAGELGHRASETVIQQVEQAFSAALVDERAAADVASGRLTKPPQTDAPFGLVAPTGHSPRTTKKPAQSKPSGELTRAKAALADARRALADAEAEARQRERAAAEAAASLRAANKRVEERAAAVHAARQRVDDLSR